MTEVQALRAHRIQEQIKETHKEHNLSINRKKSPQHRLKNSECSEVKEIILFCRSENLQEQRALNWALKH